MDKITSNYLRGNLVLSTQKTVDLQWLEPKGKTFENIVGDLLKNMFPNINFKQTRYVHDGGKDFYTITDCDCDRIWVEAKNYTNHLELSKFANTFIMADINEVNRLIIFSVSPLTENARINVARYAAYNKKRISVYAGKDVLLLINKYRDFISFKNYFSNPLQVERYVASLSIDNTDELTVDNQYYKTTQLNLTYRRNEDSGILPCNGMQIPLFSTIAHEIIVTNNSLCEEKTATIKDGYFNSPNFEFYLPDGFKKNIEIPPASTVVAVVFMKLVALEDNLKLPSAEFDIQIKTISQERIVECCWIGEIPFFGSGWEQLQALIDSIKNGNAVNQALVYGKSGVGKTRFIQETSVECYKLDYRIISLDFRSLKELSLRDMLKKIICNIFVINVDNADATDYSNDAHNINSVFHDILFNSGYDCKKNQTKITSLLCGLLQNKKVALLLDNVQDLGAEATDFLINLSQLVSGNNTVDSIILFCFNTDFFGDDVTAKRLYNALLQSSMCHKVALTDFTEGEAKTYLRDCLDPTGRRRDLNSFYDAIINKFKTNPFVLKQLILYLKQRRIINFAGSAIYISDYEGMSKVLDELPYGIQEILNCRYEYLIREYGDDKNLKRILWSILFFGGISRLLLQEIDYYEKPVRNLNNYGFTDYDDKFRLVFSHQLIEKYFCLKISNSGFNSIPQLSFIDDSKFLEELLCIVSQKFPTLYCIQEMLLRNRLAKPDKSNVELTLNKLLIVTPDAIILPLIINVAVDVFASSMQIPYELELKAAYQLCVSCQQRFYNSLAAKISERLIDYERQTFSQKTQAADELVKLFKHFTFLLPLNEKQDFLSWLDNEGRYFGLDESEYLNFKRWTYNRLCKNLGSLHDFDGALLQIKKALKIAKKRRDFGAIAEDELEYGNIYAYFDKAKTIKHWSKCAKSISKIKDKSIYFQVYELAYGILANLLCGKTKNLSQPIDKLRSLRKQTFLYQKLLIDDVYADYLLIKYSKQPEDVSLQRQVIPLLENMKSDSFMYDTKFTILASYKLLVTYILIERVEHSQKNKALITNLIFELIDNGVFNAGKLEYSDMILRDIADYCFNNNEVCSEIADRLPELARVAFNEHVYNVKNSGHLKSITVLSDRKKTLNLLHFNYVF